ncbi:exo-beta-N-acetylmuramidase NamZ family protein [Metaplanococcus flavidus]|uniref:Exo-beta-N-acetylmuramidase NamZ domain-containing protein n=1 Tax=Metaplanococcus flavidus TaxID=569883 RepID=A0ABW3L895_9BACL
MAAAVKLGLEVFLENRTHELKGKRIGLLTNQTGADSQLESAIRLFHHHPDLDLRVLFAPEHGLKTDAKEGEKFGDSVHSETGVPVYSLYGKTKKPTDAMMQHIDVAIYDLQDIGARYYTYIYSMAYLMEACVRTGKKMYVLDRPNPIGGEALEGNLIESDFTSFVGLYPIPNRHGMTAGELALYFNETFKIGCDLEVVKMEGWQSGMLFPDTGLPWIPPSPNTTGLDMMLLYPGTCLIEGTNLSEGRGTAQPFEIVGAPFIDGIRLQDAVNALGLQHVKARAISFTPAQAKRAGELCEGIQLHIMDRQLFQPLASFIRVLSLIAEMYPEELVFLEYGNLKHPMFDLLAGTDLLRNALANGGAEEFLQYCQKDSETFADIRRQFLLYR